MPTDARDERKAQRAENARRWGQWLTQAMARAKIEPRGIVDGSHGAIDKGTVSHWMLGDYGISVENALIIARILRQDPVETLRAAGHEAPADGLSASIADAAARARRELADDLRKHLIGLSGDLDDRITRYLSPDLAQSGDREGEDAS